MIGTLGQSSCIMNSMVLTNWYFLSVCGIYKPVKVQRWDKEMCVVLTK